MGTSGLNNLHTHRGTAVKKRPSFNFLLFNFELGVSRWFTDYSHRRYIVAERWPQLKEARSRERRNKLGLDDSHVLLLINGWTNGDFFSALSKIYFNHDNYFYFTRDPPPAMRENAILSLLSISMGTCGRLACSRRSDSRAPEKNSRRKKKRVETRGGKGERTFSRSNPPPPPPPFSRCTT